MAFEVFAVFDTTIHLPYIRPQMTEDEFLKVIGMAENLTLYHYDTAISPDDKIMALSTCTYSTQDHPSLPLYNDYRFVVMAKLVEPDAARKDKAVFTVNADPMSPEVTRGFFLD
jgi:hypothetical protein